MTTHDLAGLCERLLELDTDLGHAIWDRGCQSCALASNTITEAAAAIERLAALATAYDELRAAWTDRQATALHGDRQQYEFCCRRFDDAFDRADAARTALKGAADAS